MLVFSIAAHVSGGAGRIQLQITRGSATYTIGAIIGSLVTDQGMATNTGANTDFPENGIVRTSAGLIDDQLPILQHQAASGYSIALSRDIIIPLLAGDTLQFIATNGTAGATTYIDDLVVMII
jgi:hypothetical protein